MPADPVAHAALEETTRRFAATLGVNEKTARAVLLGVKIGVTLVGRDANYPDSVIAKAISGYQQRAIAEAVRLQNISNALDPSRGFGVEAG